MLCCLFHWDEPLTRYKWNICADSMLDNTNGNGLNLILVENENGEQKTHFNIEINWSVCFCRLIWLKNGILNCAFFVENCRTSNIKDGTIKMNGRDRNISQFRKLSAYIMQDNQLHGNLTVEEAMTVAANLKLSAKVSKSDKNIVVSISFTYFYVYKTRLFQIGIHVCRYVRMGAWHAID